MSRSRAVAMSSSAAAALLLVGAAFAGGPLFVCNSGQAYVWPSGGTAIPYRTDLGGLGGLDNPTADQLVQDAFAAWAGVPTATASFTKTGSLALDIDVTNYLPIYDPAAPDGVNEIVFDADGQIFDEIFGEGSGVLGFARPIWVNPATCEVIEGYAFLNGPEIDDPVRARDVMVHELGHFTGLAHSVVNGQIFASADNNGPSPHDPFVTPPLASDVVETMYPIYLGTDSGWDTPEADDAAILSALYPVPEFAAAGTIAGTVLASDEFTQFRGVNVIARNLANPFEDAVSAISGDFADPEDPADLLRGTYSLRNLTNGASYAVYTDRLLAGVFSTPPLLPFPGNEEFHNGANESSDPDIDDPTDFSPVVPDPLAGGIDFLFNGASQTVVHVASGDTAAIVQAIESQQSPVDELILNLEPGTYTFTESAQTFDGENAVKTVSTAVTINGAGRDTTILERDPAAPLFRFFHVDGGNASLTLRSLTLRGGHISEDSSLANLGGAILADFGGSLDLFDVAIVGNTAAQFDRGFGGGVSAGTSFGPAAPMTIDGCIVSGNRAGNGGGGLQVSAGSAIGNTEIFDNEAGGDGGGLFGPATLIDVILRDNVAGGQGGAMTSSTAHLTRVSVLDNVAASNAGGIHNAGDSLTLVDSVVHGNSGMGILSLGGGSLDLSRSEISANQGSGVICGKSGTMVRSSVLDNLSTGFALIQDGVVFDIVNSTVGGNQATGISVIQGRLNVTNATIARNVGDDGGGIANLGLFGPIGEVHLRNAVVADNTAATGPDCSGPVISDGHSLVGDPTDCALTPGPGDLSGDPGLGAFVVSEIFGQSHYAVLPGAAIIDAGDDALCPSEDQLGIARPLDGDHDGVATCDVGATEQLAEQTIAVLPSNPRPAESSRIAACVTLSAFAGVSGFGATLSWDPDVLAFISFTAGTAPFDAPIVNTDNAAAGFLNFAAADAVGADGEIGIGCVELDVTGLAGSATELDLELTSLTGAGTFADLLPVTTVVDAPVAVVGSCLVGDTNEDDTVNSGDALLILAHEIGLEIPAAAGDAIAARCADANGDGDTDSIDASIALAVEVGIPVDPSFPVGGSNQSFDRCDVCASPGAKAGSIARSGHRNVRAELDYRRKPARFRSTVDVAVAIDTRGSGHDLASYGATLTWDPELYRLVDVEGGDAPGFSTPRLNLAEVESGVLRAAHARPRGTEGRVEILRLRFRRLARAPRQARRPAEPFRLELTSLGAAGPRFENLLPLLDRQED